MIKVLTQRSIPPGFDTRDETQVARHARYAVDAMASLGGRIHWICTYITEDSLFGVIVFETEEDLASYQRNAGISVNLGDSSTRSRHQILLTSHCNSRDSKDFRHQRRINNHVRSDDVIAQCVNPGVPGTQRQHAFDHSWSDILKQHEDQGQYRVPR